MGPGLVILGSEPFGARGHGGSRAAGNVGNHIAVKPCLPSGCCRLHRAHGQPASRPQTKSGPGRGAEQADDRCSEAGAGRAGGGGWERPEEAVLQKAAPEKAGVQQSFQPSGQGPCPTPTPATTFILAV